MEETKAKRAELAGQLEKDRGLAFAMASLKLLGRKAAPGESQQTQLIRGIGEAGDAFIGEVSRLKKENRDADDKLRQSEILLATAQQQRKEGKVKAAMDSEDKAEAKEQDAYKTKVGVREKTTQLLGGMAQAEMHDKTQKEVAAMHVAAQRDLANKPGEMERMMSEVDAIRTGKKSFQGKTGEEGVKAYQDTLAQVGAARYGAKYTGPDKSIERSVQVQKALEQDDIAKGLAKNIQLLQMAPYPTPEQQARLADLKQQYEARATQLEADIRARAGSMPTTSGAAPTSGATKTQGASAPPPILTPIIVRLPDGTSAQF